MLDIKFYNSIKRKYPSAKIYNYLYQNVGIEKITGSVCCKHCHTYEVESDSLFLTNTKSGNLIDYKFYGNSEQEEVLSENLFDKDEATLIDAYISNTNHTLEREQNPGTNRVFVFEGEYNSTYIISKLAGKRFSLGTANSNNIPFQTYFADYQVNHEGTSITVSTSNTKRFIYVFYYSSQADTSTEQELLNSVQIKKVTYNYKYFGDKTKNLFTTAYYDYSSPGVVYESKGSNSFNQKGSSAWNSATFMIDGLTVGTKYTISCNATGTKYISIKDDSFDDVAESPGNITFTAPTDTVYISFYSSLGTAIEYDNTYSDIQLEESETVTSFEPFGYKIPIKKYGKNLLENNFDMLPSIASEETDGTVTFNGTLLENTWCGLRSLTLPPGTYTFSHNKTFDNGSYFLVNNQSVSGNSLILTFTEETTFVVGLVLLADTYSNETMKLQIEPGSTSSQYEKYEVPTITNIYLGNQLETDDDYIDYGNQKIIVNSVEETIDLPEIPTLDGSTNYIVNTEIQPSEVYVKYYSTERG